MLIAFKEGTESQAGMYLTAMAYTPGGRSHYAALGYVEKVRDADSWRAYVAAGPRGDFIRLPTESASQSDMERTLLLLCRNLNNTPHYTPEMQALADLLERAMQEAVAAAADLVEAAMWERAQ